MNRQARKAPELAALLDRHRFEIASAWVEMVHQIPNSHYLERPSDELRASVLRNLDAIVEAFSTTSYKALNGYLAEVSNLRWQHGFDIGEVIEGLLLMKEAILPSLWKDLTPGSPEAYKITAAFDDCLRYMLGRFGHLYAKAIHQHLTEQQRRTAVMEERQRLARELHDSVTQSLYSITLYAEAAGSMLEAGNQNKAAEHLRKLQEAAQESLKEMRLLIFDLHPPVLEVVDDHDIVRKGICALLEAKEGIEVVAEADNGQEAVAKAEASRPDVALMDLVMPVMDGIEATRQIAARYPHVRILVLTSFATDDKVFLAIKAGALGYLLKDSTPDDLVQAIRRVYRGEPSLHPTIARKILHELGRPLDRPPTQDPLTERELEVLRLVGQGLLNQEIAERLVVTEATVRTHVSNILSKLHLASRTQAALYALREGLASLDNPEQTPH